MLKKPFEIKKKRHFKIIKPSHTQKKMIACVIVVYTFKSLLVLKVCALC